MKFDREIKMEWLGQNWFWLSVLIAFIAMHLFGHGRHGGHMGRSHHDGHGENDADEVPHEGHRHHC